ncbi:fibronectin type III domain-containing protein [Tenacibaculum maritimum]|uniref:fibronectin type III domain-containing protein n=1 Tax=Tenacibaculum maritimum TaxID=107401 RepID=UPI0010A4015F|nr:fibronectin type III domain-containing protein [Tenacibaculum maritimum]QCD62929.1 hypothetical protein B9C57_10500 [Tenacibaculum maritimum]
MKKKYLFTLVFVFISSIIFSQVITIGNGTETDDQIPINPYYTYTYSQNLYLSSEINQSGTIYRITFKGKSGLNIPNSNEWVVYLGHTNKNSLANNNWIPTTEMSEVFNGTVSIKNDNITIHLDTPFPYDGINNLIIAVDENGNGYDSDSNDFLSSNVSEVRSLVSRSDNENPDPANISTTIPIQQNAIANIDLDFNIVPCAPTSTLTATNLTTTSASLNWSNEASATSWIIEYGVNGFELGSGTTINANTNPTLSINNLNSGTTYQFYVKTVCENNATSSWSLPFSFFTKCDTYSIPHFEGFENNLQHDTPLSNCITQENVSGSQSWKANNTFTTNNRGAHTGNWNAFMPDSNEDWFFIPVQLTAGISYMTELYARQNKETGAKITIKYGTSNNASSMTETILDEKEVTNGIYQKIRGSFTPNATGIYYIGYLGKTENFNYLSIDDITVKETPSCLSPNDLNATEITAHTANLNWSKEGNEASWVIEYGEIGTSQGDGTTINVTTNSHNLVGLSPNTDYHFFVKATCNTSNSIWTGPYNFKTLCADYTIPYFEGFEANYTNNTPIANCLNQENISGLQSWTANENNTANNRKPRTGNWNTVLRYSNEDWLFIPIKLNGGTSYTVQFYARQSASTGTSVLVSAAYGTAPNSSAMTNTIINEREVFNGDYQKVSGNFTPTNSATYYIGIKGKLNSSSLYLSIDDIKIDVSPNCLAPKDLNFSNLSDTSTLLNWTPEGSETNWQIEYGPTGFTLGSGNIINTSTNTHNLIGLTANTAYEFFVRANCGTETSEWSNSAKFKTTCSPFTAPYVQKFDQESTPFIDSCWLTKVENSTGASTSIAINSSTTKSSSAPNSIKFYNGNDLNGDYYLISPKFSDLDKTKRIRFRIYKDISGDNEGDSFEVGVITDPSNTNTYSSIESFTESDFTEDTWKDVFINFDTYTEGAAHIAIKYKPGTDTYNNWYLDDFIYDITPTTVPSCANNVVAVANNSNCGNNGVVFSWDTVTGAEAYQLTIGTTSGGNDILNNEILTQTNYSLQYTDINTTYYWKVTPYNSIGNANSCEEKSFKTVDNGCYCFPLSSNTSTYISNFTTSHALRNINNNSGFSSNGYADYYDTVSLTETTGGSFLFSAEIVGGTAGFALWVDWNNDFRFDPRSELYEPASTNLGNGPFVGAVIIPNYVTNGSTYRMRIITDYNDLDPSDNSCLFDNINSRGEAEDYKIIIDNSVLSNGDDVKVSTFNLYPTPVKELLKIESRTPIENISVSNMLGQEVLKIGNINKKSTSINLAPYKNGFYIIKLSSKQASESIKIIKN